MKHITRAALVVVAIAAMTVSWAPPVASASTADDEIAFVHDINALRESRGVGSMSVHPMLTVIARNFAAQMAAHGNIFHNPQLADQAPSSWIKLGENVGVGGSEPALHQAFIDSPGHLRNLLDGDYGYTGIGVVKTGDRMWVVEVFMRSDAPLPQVSPPNSPVTQKAGMATRFQLAVRGYRR